MPWFDFTVYRSLAFLAAACAGSFGGLSSVLARVAVFLGVSALFIACFGFWEDILGFMPVSFVPVSFSFHCFVNSLVHKCVGLKPWNGLR